MQRHILTSMKEKALIINVETAVKDAEKLIVIRANSISLITTTTLKLSDYKGILMCQQLHRRPTTK